MSALRNILCFIAITLFMSPVNAQETGAVYTATDSLRITEILEEASQTEIDGSDVLWFANHFIDIPYGSATLETGPTERLSVTLKALDCTTLVDIVTSLTLCHRNKKYTFTDFLDYLRRLRYKDGVIAGYPSRNHYFSSWILGAEEAGFVHEVGPADSPISPFTASEQLNISYMTDHPDEYAALRRDPGLKEAIATTEAELTGRTVYYIPVKALDAPRDLLSCIRDGDIIAMVTKKQGLDVSHLGFAVWLDDGKLHMLNASLLRKRVVLEPRTFVDYLKQQRLCTGIRIIRILK